MGESIGLDLFLRETANSVRPDGKCIWRGTCRVLDRATVGFVSPIPDLRGLPSICIEARHASTMLGMTLCKTGANDAGGLAHLAEGDFGRHQGVVVANAW